MNDIFGFSGPLKYIIVFSNETQCVLGAPPPPNCDALSWGLFNPAGETDTVYGVWWKANNYATYFV
jgi:hypothetical protein